MRKTACDVCSFVLALPLFICAHSAFAADRKIDFSRDIRPILSKNCFSCHGQSDEGREARLRLDQRDSAVAELESGERAVVPGKPEESALYARVASTDDDMKMPPAETGNKLSQEQIDLLRQWIAGGAEYSGHWSFTKPVRPALPAVKDVAWSSNGIDHFVLARLEEAGLRPNEPADRHELIRRLSFDLRGLPPTPNEVQAFVRDESPGAYERLVERFLADPAYGERWARVWLDLARFADSMGYATDPLRTIWRYRDWTIDAFNRNLPFDQFTIEQLAGDMLPKPTLDQLMATAFHRNATANDGGGTIDEEFRVAAVLDRVDTTFQVWMGLTYRCAQCHNHKYDPISQKEYYEAFAIFNQSADADLRSEAPVIAAPPPEMAAKIAAAEDEVARLWNTADTPEIAAAQAAWEARYKTPVAWERLKPVEMLATGGFPITFAADESFRILDRPESPETYLITARPSLKKITAIRLETVPLEELPNGGSGRNLDGSFLLHEVRAHVASRRAAPARYLRIEAPGDARSLAMMEVEAMSGGANVARTGKTSQSSANEGAQASRAIDGLTVEKDGKQSVSRTTIEKDPWWEIEFLATKQIDKIILWKDEANGEAASLAGLRVSLLDAERRPVWTGEINGPQIDPESPTVALAVAQITPVKFASAVANYENPKGPISSVIRKDGKKPEGAWDVRPYQDRAQTAVLTFAKPVELADDAVLTIEMEFQQAIVGLALGSFRLSATDSTATAERGGMPGVVSDALNLPREQRTPQQNLEIAVYHRLVAPELEDLRKKIAEVEKTKPVAPTLPIMRELPPESRRKTRLLVKGNYQNLGEEVIARFPKAFYTGHADEGANRLALAQWLVSRENPLTARVLVNRYWSRLFGLGLVETEEDFGLQGESPSHPELLDWLAVEFMDNGWDMKQLLRTLVSSAAYRQSAVVSPEKLERDPRNRLISRGPRFRLEAEMIRDQALAVSGLLSRKMKGPSVFPPQPEGVWALFSLTATKWPNSEGEDRYRRGVYTFWRRAAPYPSMVTFDATSRELCTIRRGRSNTPLQAFVTLNDPVYVEAAQALARRIVREGGATPEERVAFGLQLCLARPGSKEQVQELVRLYADELEHYRKETDAALKAATEPLGPLPAGMDAAELASWTAASSILLNLDAMLTK